MPKKHRPKEKLFQNSFARVASQLGYDCVEIPDVIGSIAERERKRQGKEYQKTYVAKPRPCDAVFSSEDGNLYVEFKYGNNHLSARQRHFGEKIEKMNGLFVVIRKKESIKNGKISIVYRIENSQRSVYYEGNDIGKLVYEVGSFIKIKSKENYERRT